MTKIMKVDKDAAEWRHGPTCQWHSFTHSGYCTCGIIVAFARHREQAVEAQAAEIERLRAANGILEDGLQEVGDDYPGSSCQEWCQHQVKMARAALEDRP